ncbi:MAG: DNA mismatch repair protein MutS [Lachnospiraceae bacterium]|nr:DNA mismatch repair protein MutS [Lachnospiraceae bacterium]
MKETLSPMMQHYMEIKSKYSDCLVFYRLGDFYEMFFEDAEIASRELELTLTGRDCGLAERAPMCGVPFHAADTYISRLVDKGYRVAICEQLEDPKEAKGMVKRDVTRIVTPGTNVLAQGIDETRNTYLMGILWMDGCFGISTVDVSTGDYFVTEVSSARKVFDEITKFGPSEIVCNPAFLISGVDTEDIKNRLGIAVTTLADRLYDGEVCNRLLLNHFHVSNLYTLGLGNMETGAAAAGAVLAYLYETQKTSLSHITKLQPYSAEKYMVIDAATRRNLELTETLREKLKRGSLLWVIDRTRTAMGARLLRLFLEQPLLKKEDITARQSAIAEFNENVMTRDEVREYLGAVYDLERLICRVSYRSASPRDLLAFSSSLKMLPHIKRLLAEFHSKLIKSETDDLDTLEDLQSLIERAIHPDAPLTVKEGGMIRDGYNEEVDRLRQAKTQGKTWLAELEAREREATGIRNLKIKYNNVFGYFLEVTNSFRELVPETWKRKQTLSGSERYTTPELKELEDTILNAEDHLSALEYRLFSEVRDAVSEQIVRIQKTAKAVAMIDALASLAYVAERNRYVCPQINKQGRIRIVDGRHPVVEQVLPGGTFVANNTELDNDANRVAIITGPNMAGKSTYMRQTALIVLLAQIGSFVPAREADIGIVDRIFTRVGASDDLASGQSTFMVEMTEVANILKNATKNSLLILDEIGRGTSTFDGLSIAWSVIEHVADKRLIGAKTLFATHYHELTELEGKLDGVCNYCIAVKEQGDTIVFLRKIIRGGADKSYGIQVARLAGVPESVLHRAEELVDQLTQNDIAERAREIFRQTPPPQYDDEPVSWIPKHRDAAPNQMSMFGNSAYADIVERIREMNLQGMTPIDALNFLFKIQDEINKID